ncbi:MAG: hypothetical protein M1840_008268 [Geoglossum simile]|nr:MAG: hypothetical protein M1840_008268 [Geoglossum simile]
MNSRQLASGRQGTLEQLAREAGVLLEVDRSSLQAPRQRATFRRGEDQQLAEELLKQTLGQFKSKSKLNRHDLKVVNQILRDLVRENGSPGVAEVLLDMGGNVNIYRPATRSLIKKIKGVDPSDERSPFLQDATRNAHVDMVRLLAPRADQRTQDEAMEIALDNRHLVVMQILLEHGANASRYQTQFKSAVERGEEELVSLMMRARSPVPPQCITDSLKLARNVRIVSILVQYGADCRDGNVLKGAIVMGQSPDLGVCIALIMGESRPSDSLLGSLVGRAITRKDVSIVARLRLVEALLCAGATGNTVDDSLIWCCRNGVMSGIKLLLHYGASINHNDAEALISAVGRSDVDTVDLLLRGAHSPPSQKNVGIAVSQIDKSVPQAVVHLLMSNLLPYGASGSPLDDALVEFAVKNYTSTAALLVHHGASINYHNARALQHAVSNEHISMVSTLLESSNPPTKRSLEEVFPLLLRSNISRQNRFIMTQGLLRTGFRSHVMDDMLLGAVQDPTLQDDRLVATLLEAGTDINAHEGQCLQAVVRQAVVEKLKFVFERSNPSAKSVSACIPAAMAIGDSRVRCEITELLLSRGANGECVSQALLNSIVRSPTDANLNRMLLDLGRADVNYKGGECIRASIRSRDVGTMQTIMRFGEPNVTSISNALAEAMALRSSEPTKPTMVELLLRKTSFRNGSVWGSRGTKILVPQHTIDFALREEFRINEGQGRCSTKVLELLVKAGASVNYQNTMVLAVESGSVENVELLLAGNPTIATLDIAFLAAMALRPARTRFQLCEVLLRKGVSERKINRALVASIVDTGSETEDFMELLLRFRADVNFDNGLAACLAAERALRVKLRLLMGADPEPSPSTRQKAFSVAIHIDAEPDRFGIFRILLQAGVAGDCVHDALVCEVVRGGNGGRFCELLLEHGASVEHRSGEAIQIAAGSGFTAVLELLLARKPSLPVLTRAFAQVWALRGDQRYSTIKLLLKAGMVGDDVHSALVHVAKETPCELRLLKLLIDFNTNVHFERSERLADAASYCATRCDIAALKILLEIAPANAVVGAFDAAMSKNVWHSPEGMCVMRLLLDKTKTTIGAVHTALVNAIKQHMQPTAWEFVEVLFQHGADVNHDRGMALRCAFTLGDTRLIKKLQCMAPSADSLSMAVPYALAMPTDEQKLVDIVDMIMETPGERPDFGFRHPQFEWPTLFLCLDRYPNWAKALEKLVRAGYPVNQNITYSVEAGLGPEQVSLLCWALCQKEHRISDASIDVLIDRGADVNFITSFSKKTPLLLAAEELRPHVVQRLVQKDADPSVRDCHDMSPLAYASRGGDQSIVGQLVGLRATERDDGSLHDTARGLHVETMQILLKHGHDPDFSSIRHKGRSALGELCRKASASNSPSRRIKQAIGVLLDAGSNPMLKSKDKTVLTLALDNEDPIPIVTAILNAIRWDEMDENLILYTAPDGHCYSPVMYVEEAKNKGPESEREPLRKLLTYKRIVRRHFSIIGPQPKSLVGPPKYIEQEEIERRKIEHKLELQRLQHETRLQQQREEEVQSQMIRQQSHTLALAQGDEIAEREDSRLRQLAQTRMRITDEESKQEAAITEHKHRGEIEHQNAFRNQSLGFTRAEHNLAIESGNQRTAQAAQEQRDLKAIAALQSQMMAQQEELWKAKERSEQRRIEYPWDNESVD